MKNVILPELGEKVEQATVSFWFFKEGDTVKEKDELVELATEKTAFNLPSPASGTLVRILVPEGGQVRVGEALAVIND